MWDRYRRVLGAPYVRALVVSSVLLPTLVLLALARIRRFSGEEEDDE